MTATSSLSKLVITILVVFHLGMQLSNLIELTSHVSGGGYNRVEAKDCFDCPDLPQRAIYTTDFSIANDTKPPPSYLEWSTKKPKIPSDWSYATPLLAKVPTKHSSPDPTKKVIVHYHMQHNAGTSFFQVARKFTAATRACWQTHKHCFVSYNEEVEANNIRNNYHQHGIQYVSYEAMLPPRFPLPFVSESARDGLFFTTILRDPMKRLISWARSDRYKPKQIGAPPENFWNDVTGNSGIYVRENLNVRWLSGVLETITEDHVNIAKCRLQLFDLIIVDTLYDTAVNDVICPLNNWEGNRYCNATKARAEYKSKKPNPLNGTDSHFVGAWIERLRPSFELYDYARILSYAQLNALGVKDIPQISEVPSYIETLSKYTNIEFFVSKKSRVNFDNIDRFHPPKEFCDNMKLVWGSNTDEVPYIRGIGALDSL
ncbi:hypothetical protein ACHAXM_007286 [Skeletonema potamos]|jgi:hypothetical protein